MHAAVAAQALPMQQQQPPYDESSLVEALAPLMRLSSGSTAEDRRRANLPWLKKPCGCHDEPAPPSQLPAAADVVGM